MNRYFLFFILIFQFDAPNLKAQTKEDIAILQQEMLVSMIDNPQHFQKLIEYYSKINSDDALVYKIKSNMLWGNFQESVRQLYELKPLIESKENPHLYFQYYWLSFQLNNILGIDFKAKKDLDIILKFLKKNDNNYFYTDQILFSTTEDSFSYLSLDQRINLLKEMMENEEKSNIKYASNRINYLLGLSYLEKNKMDSAEIYFKKSIDKNQNEFLNSYGNLGLARIYKLKNKPDKAKTQLDLLTKVAYQTSDVQWKKQYYNLAIEISAMLSLRENILKSDSILKSVQTSFDDSRNKGRALLVSKIEENYRKTESINILYWKRIIIGTIILSFLLTLSWIIFLKLRKKKTIKSEPKNFSIPDKTEETILVKLAKFENSQKFTQKNISLKSLATQLGTNPRYLSEIINKHKNVNFNTYINELRIDYIIKQLETNPRYRTYKVSYLAEESGFSSHSLFTTTFKNKIGKSPTEFIQNLK